MTMQMILRLPVILALTLGVRLLSAQVEQASVTGIISDKSGAAVPEAQVSAENLATGIKTATPTNASGNYYLTLVPGDYRIAVSHQGFATAVVPKLTLSVAQQAAINLSLEVSSVQQQITVSEIAPLIEQESASLGATLAPEQFVELPMDGRNAYTLVVLAPGVIPKGNPGTGPLINGGRSNANGSGLRCARKTVPDLS